MTTIVYIDGKCCEIVMYLFNTYITLYLSPLYRGGRF